MTPILQITVRDPSLGNILRYKEIVRQILSSIFFAFFTRFPIVGGNGGQFKISE